MEQQGTYTEEQVREAISLSRLLTDPDDKDWGEFEIQDCFGLTEVCTHNWALKYNENDILNRI